MGQDMGDIRGKDGDDRHHLPWSESPALSFRVVAECGRARSSRMTLPHYTCHTPMFMPVGTQGTGSSCVALNMLYTSNSCMLLVLKGLSRG